jgi:hypothetical protein
MVTTPRITLLVINERNCVVFQDLKFRFLTLCWNLTVYGSAFFTGYVNIKVRFSIYHYIGV